MRYEVMHSWPEVSRDETDMLTLKPPYLGLDFEWVPGRPVPSIVGVSDGATTVSVPWSETARENLMGLVYRAERGEFRIVGHNILQAEFPLLEAMGADTRKLLPGALDTILLWYLTHAHLCKSSQKGADDDGSEGRGFMGIWHMASVCTNLPYYKKCLTSTGSIWRDGACRGPCPEHDVWGYNGVDALAPVLALPELLLLMRTRRVEHLYPLHAELMVALERIRSKGIRIDVDYVSKLRGEWASSVEAMKGEWKGTKCVREGVFPFNPESPKQVIAWFKARGIVLDDCTEDTIREASEENEDELLSLLLEYKELGDGPDRWFGEKFLDGGGYVHPRLNPYTSSARLACTSPNMQNVGKRRVDRHTGEKVGKRIRRAVIAPEGMKLYRSDWKSAENLNLLWQAGYRDLPQYASSYDAKDDLHQWMVENVGIKETDPFALALGSARDAAKSVTHATNLGEGLQLVEPGALRSTRIKREVEVGARTICADWTFEGKVVTFTGINMARRAFGSASFENRRRALEAAEKYFARFPKMRELQRRITAQIERDGVVRPPHGYCTLSFGAGDDRIKQALAIYGSQPVSHFSKRAILRAQDSDIIDVRLQVHDELLAFANARIPPREVKAEILRVMDTRGSGGEFDDLAIPVDVTYGDNWSDQFAID